MSELDLSKYEGHTAGPWVGPISRPVDLCLMVDAPLLLAEVKRLRAARQAWAIRAAEESARGADALLEAAEEMLRYSGLWPEYVSKFDALMEAVEAAKVKYGE